MSDDRVELKPCPYPICGSVQVTTSTCENITDDARPEITWCVICKACAARVDAITEAEAIAEEKSNEDS